jgi:prevent-host-death family protein
MRQINVHEAKTHLSRLLEDVARGEEIIIAKAGKPYARLVAAEPLQPKKKSAWEHMADKMKGQLTSAEVDYLCSPTDPDIIAAFAGEARDR